MKRSIALQKYLTHLNERIILISLVDSMLTVPAIQRTNPFSTNVPIMDKLGSWFLLTKCLKNTSGRVTF